MVTIPEILALTCWKSLGQDIPLDAGLLFINIRNETKFPFFSSTCVSRS